jgi:hypothetical protein
LSAILRRQKLGVAVERLRRIVATDESMSGTQQIANRLAYRRLLYDLERTPEILPGVLTTSPQPAALLGDDDSVQQRPLPARPDSRDSGDRMAAAAVAGRIPITYSGSGRTR